MQKILLLALLLLGILEVRLFAQSCVGDDKRDHTWLWGYESNPTDTRFGGTIVDFNTNPPTFRYKYLEANFSGCDASISDQAGNLLFYTNGVTVYNRLHEVMENGKGLNEGDFANNYTLGYIIWQGATILPLPNSNRYYYILHIYMDKWDQWPYFRATKLLYTLVDMQGDGGLGAVVEKNKTIAESLFHWGQLTACRHANGRDWWVMLPLHKKQTYYKFLLDPKGISPAGVQSFPQQRDTGLGQAIFSPDGTKYIRNEGDYIGKPINISIFDFDRCTGMLNNLRMGSSADTTLGNGAAISANSRYLYTTNHLKVHQYDLWAADIFASKKTVGVWNNYYSPYPFKVSYTLAQLAPDNKIYIATYQSGQHLAVIEKPDLPGAACGFNPMFPIPTINHRSVPNMPNFRLGALLGSPCDTICNRTAVAALSLLVSPNPATDWVRLRLNYGTAQTYEWTLYDALGRKVGSERIPSGQLEKEVQLPNVANGIYLWQLSGGRGEKILAGKLLIAR